MADDDRRQAAEWLEEMGFVIADLSTGDHVKERELLAELDRRLHLAFSKRCARDTSLPDKAA